MIHSFEKSEQSGEKGPTQWGVEREIDKEKRKKNTDGRCGRVCENERERIF
jgi:hypothetical protein